MKNILSTEIFNILFLYNKMLMHVGLKGYLVQWKIDKSCFDKN